MSPGHPPRIVILGAGPAGLGAAYRLARRPDTAVTVVERSATVGGNAGSFELAGQPVDYGSHRLHPTCDPEVLGDIRVLLGKDLVDRPRHGRIRLRGRWIHFPLKPVDLALRLPPGFALGSGRRRAAQADPGSTGPGSSRRRSPPYSKPGSAAPSAAISTSRTPRRSGGSRQPSWRGSRPADG